ncbi:FAD-binding protein, partial [Arthrobacter sp. GCM10027362]|uniref:FAD-binding protein n=1 Tax=Arthrobacter sp. GCM10027362 TaxID=3273379 RepID=UPI0036423B18
MEFVYPRKAPEYQMDLPGARLGGRAILPRDTDARILGERRLDMQPYLSSYTVFGYMPQVGPDINEFFHVNQSVKSFVYVARKLLRTWFDAARYKRPVLRSNGNALMTLMAKSALDAGVRLWKSSPVLELTRGGDGAVTGAVLGGEHAGTVHARL